MKKTVYLIGNPIAGGGAQREIEKAQSLLTAEGCEVSLFLTRQKGDAEAYARKIAEKAVRSAVPMVIAAGGDGTINEVANGLAGSSVPMAILPFGTTSVLAREIGIRPGDTEGAVQYALRFPPNPVSLGRLAFPDGSNRFFLLMAGIGFDGEVVHGMNPALKRWVGKGAYALSTFRTVLKYKPRPLSVAYARVDGSVAELRGTSVIVSNASRYGGEFVITPGADLSSPSLKLMVAQASRPGDFLSVLAAIARGKTIPGATYETVTSVRVDGESHMQIDGDYAGTTPVVIDVVPGSLQLVMRRVSA
ncbi:MAG TPA: diacylglycerol kinase family protein [Dissulfurispiraceae bacterium]|nr:diacylglycerol kinase family protein [Dissulfurispiraceae bacterium]